MSNVPATDVCGVTVVSWNSMPRLSVVDVTFALICRRVADRACAMSASARRMSAAAMADAGFRAIARSIA